MKLQCDHCHRTATGTEDQLREDGWVWIKISAPVRKRFVGCCDHEADAGRAALAVIRGHGTRPLLWFGYGAGGVPTPEP